MGTCYFGSLKKSASPWRTGPRSCQIFFVVTAEGKAEFHETKGFWREDARAKIKIAAQQFPCFVFKGVKKGKEGWEYELFTPIVRKRGKERK